MSDRPALVEERPFEPLPQGLLIDTSVLGGIGTTGTDRRAFIEYFRSHDKDVYLSSYVVAELQPDEANVSGINNWLQVMQSEDWLAQLPPLDMSIRIHDAPKAGDMIDLAHERVAKLEDRDRDEVRKTDPAFAGCVVQLLGGYGYDTVGLIIDDRNAERALSDVISETLYEKSFRMFRGEEALAMMVEELDQL